MVSRVGSGYSLPAHRLQGLSRYNDDAGTQADYIVVEMVKRLLGEQWLTQYVHRANNGGIERVLL